MSVIVFNELRDAIQSAIDKALNGRPIADDERQGIYESLLGYYDEYGVIPDFSLEAK